MKYEIIVVGAGHAGVEAALACARKNHRTLLITTNINNIATMPCNPSIGGSAKGIVVREIDALGGQMGISADKNLLQMKMLNSSKGPAVHSLRAQIDKVSYPNYMKEVLNNQDNLTILEATVEDLIIKNNKIYGIIANNKEIYADAVILTTGTYLKSDILIGNTRTSSGPNNETPSLYLSDNLKKYGFKILRLKTGTPPRIDKASIDFSKTKIEEGDSVPYTFSHDLKPSYNIKEQLPCYLIYTTKLTHQIIKDNINLSSMYGGLNDITGIGPRYCPSIEDKITRFADKERHQLFLEPESLYYDDIYLQGFSTSMPKEIQEKMVHSLPGLEQAIIKKYAYAIEYDAIYPTQLHASLETKVIKNLFTAGQINGTSGYEEAAAQGLIAGINASLKLEHKQPLILKRNEAYIGVLIDDLITKGTNEPYRLLTSRAEYRLLLRHDNADIRLREYGYSVGLITKEKYTLFKQKLEDINKLIDILKNTIITNKEKLKNINTSPINQNISLFNLLKRPEINFDILENNNIFTTNYSTEIKEQVLIQIKYEGYIKKITKEATNNLKNENKQLPKDINYDLIPNLASEARQKLKLYLPDTIGIASRISGINPSDISILLIYLRKYYNEKR
ncbi:MAG: tRNA uridine-5-carboxymethylaminomethyl(34) synthesis enzyme MnmG [bacterium]|nr:tRNA uridine-5-carboxymethylaminomethyl(34) synthesis enzyme MnmG [bacterium]